jgi:uncharacterized membrane protein YheB (UPF0754 family)
VLDALSKTLLDRSFWAYASIPFVAAVIGWFTNWVAIVMTFKPLEFRGIRPFLGWQGIIPSKAVKMATIFVDQTMYRLGTLQEVFEVMGPGEIARHIARVVDGRIPRYADEVMFYSHPAVWERLPHAVKNAIYHRLREEMPRRLHDLMHETAEQIEDLLDLKHMLIQRLDGDKNLLNRLFLEAGSAEFKFIVRSGFYFGFLFGLVQLWVWILYPAWWVLPVFGAIVGYLTNWLALEMIFRPLHPTRIGPWTLQGLFLKRQKEVSGVWCRLVTTEILTLQRLVYAMLYGPRAERTEELIRKHLLSLAEHAVEGYREIAGLAISDARWEEIRTAIGEKALQVSTDPFDHWPFNRDRAEVLERELRERMERLSPEQFQDLLRPCFQEDEMKLIIAGAVLGLIAGVAQLVTVF